MMKEIKQIMNLALPAMVEQSLQLVMGLVDAYLVSFLGLATISGISVAQSLLNIYQALFIAVAAGTSAVLATSFGKGEPQKAAERASQSLALTVIVGLTLGVFSLLVGPVFLRWLGTEATAVEQGRLYLAWVGGGILFLGLMVTLGSILRASGKPAIPMYVSFLTNALNLVLSACLVFIWDWGVTGVAVGTLLSRFIGVLILYQQLPVALSKPRIWWNKDLLSVVVPAAGERLVMRAGDVVVLGFLVTLGTPVVAGNAIGENLTQFNYMPALGIATAMVLLVAEAKGKGDIIQINRIVRMGFCLASFMMLCLAGMVFFFGSYLTSFYTGDSLAISASFIVMLYSFLGSPATAGTLVYTSVWQGLGNAKLPFYATSIGMWVVRIGLAFILIKYSQLGVQGIWLATVADNLFRWFFLYVKFKKRMA